MCADRPPRPNIVIRLEDDLGWTDTSVRMMADRPDSRSDFFRTPHLERLAREGLVFSDASAPDPVCSPTRDSILYGRTPARLHHDVLIGKASVPLGAMTIPQILKAIDKDYEDPATFSESFLRDNWLSFKLMKNLNTGETRMFDLLTDIGESQDLSQQMPQKGQELHARLTIRRLV